MALRFSEKEAIVAEVAEVAKGAYSAIGAEYRGLTVEQMTALRVEARKADVYVRVVKNTLARRALEETEFRLHAGGLSDPWSWPSPGRIPVRRRALRRRSRSRTSTSRSSWSPSAGKLLGPDDLSRSPRCRPTRRPSACSWRP